MGLPAQTIPFGEWLPDLPPYENPGALEALNVVPLTASYGPLRSLQPFGTALNTAARGLFWLKDNAGDVHNFAADTSRLYKLGSDANTWNDVSKVTDYTSTMQWEFLKFGERVIALNGADAIQYFDLGSSTDFADLPGTPPVAKHAGVVRDFIVTGNLTDEPNVLQWSGFNSSELWTPSRATQADKQTLFGRGGDIQRIVPGEYGVVLQEHSIYRMDYATAGITFQISEIERGRGTPAPGSVCWLGTSVFYFGYDGFYMFDGQQSLPLSTNKVSQWFQANADSAGLASMCGTVDRENQLVIWAFKTNALSAANDSLIIYNWGSQRWSHAMLETEYISEYASPPIGIDPTTEQVIAGETGTFDALYGSNIDGANQRSFDDPLYKGNRINVVGFTTEHKAATFGGMPLDATLDTKEITNRMTGRHLSVNSIRPEIDGENVNVCVQVGSRDTAFGNISYSAPIKANSLGECNMKERARYMRFRIVTRGNFRHATGVAVEMRDGGKR